MLDPQAQRMLPIGFFDTGVGGINVLRYAMRQLPYESFLYYCDLANAPYGSKPPRRISELTLCAVDFLMEQGIKALLVACNTATSAAIDEIRARIDIPVVGMEPALKPAVEARRQGKIVVMATPATLRLPKFMSLMDKYGDHDTVIPMPCPGLSLLVERAGPGSQEMRAYLQEVFSPLEGITVDGVVIGCTHYAFIQNDITDILGSVKMYNGSSGAVKQLERLLGDAELLRDHDPSADTRIVFHSSSHNPEDMALLERFFTCDMQMENVDNQG